MWKITSGALTYIKKDFQKMKMPGIMINTMWRDISGIFVKRKNKSFLLD